MAKLLIIKIKAELPASNHWRWEMIIVDNPSVFGNFRTRNFNEIYPDIEKFKEDFTEYSNVGLNPNFTNEQTIQTIYYLLSARYGNSTISNFDVNQFKMKLFSIIFQYGP